MRIAVTSLLVLSATAAHADSPAHEFLDEAKALLVVGACAPGTTDAVTPDVYEAHCKAVHAAQDEYKASWIAPAREFFAAHVPAGIPKTVVYPFAGGDLSTALTVFPDADEITTLSLEPAGDPTALARLQPKEIKKALATVATELTSLYHSNFSVTMNMIGAMRDGGLPTQLIFSLSALTLHGYDLESVHFFKVGADGTLTYVTDADVLAAKKITDVGVRNRVFANVEIKFHKAGPIAGKVAHQIYRHIDANLDDAHIKALPGAYKYLESKGTVSMMTKAASYLLTFDDFSKMRKYVIDHAAWMVSDTTGLAPKWGTPAGFEYETWGQWDAPNMNAGYSIAPNWKAMFASQPKRELKFRFGYPDHHLHGHLIIMTKKK